jgi:hypothetical protein
MGTDAAGRQVFGPWRMVETDAAGSNDALNLTWMSQALKLNLDESPFYGDWGIPARSAVRQQVAPDLYVTLTQQRFAPCFAALTLARQNSPTPTYMISVITQDGVKLPPRYVAAPLQ